MADPEEARERIAGYLHRRVLAISKACPGEPTLMLSGGIDSMLLAAAWQRFAEPPLCVTIGVTDTPSDDRERAAAAAAHLGLNHVAVELEPGDIQQLAASAVGVLGIDELWEIGAAVPIMAARHAANNACRIGPIISGGGADVLFAGGMRLVSPIVSRAAAEELRSRIWASMLNTFRRDRLVPDFFDRVLGSDTHRYFQMFQTLEAWTLTSDFAPSLLFAHASDGSLIDKLCLRDLAVEWGADPALVWAPKNPMQFSSGMVTAFECQARRLIEEDPTQSTYSKPQSESAETLMARLWLKHLRNIHDDGQ